MYNYKTVHFLVFLQAGEMVLQGQVGLDHCRAGRIREEMSDKVHSQLIWCECEHVECKDYEIHR